MARLNIAPTKSNLLAMKDQFAVSTSGYELLEEKREILVQELMNMVEKVRELEAKLDQAVEKAYPALKKMLMIDGAAAAEHIAKAVHYDFEFHEKKVSLGGMSFSSIDVDLPQKELFYSFLGTDSNTDITVIRFFELLSILTELASVRAIVMRLSEEVKRTQRRVNALDKLVIPQTKETKVYIESVLEERERENVFVLKALKKKNLKK